MATLSLEANGSPNNSLRDMISLEKIHHVKSILKNIRTALTLITIGVGLHHTTLTQHMLCEALECAGGESMEIATDDSGDAHDHCAVIRLPAGQKSETQGDGGQSLPVFVALTGQFLPAEKTITPSVRLRSTRNLSQNANFHFTRYVRLNS
ncbi:MAG: hypothetical protein RIQ81_2684 [Pseudomonadota bacterium]|jgi:hypothetical protein